MPPDWFEAVRPSIKTGVQELVERINADDLNDATRTFHRMGSSGLLPGTTEFEVPAPGDSLAEETVFDSQYQAEFREPAQFIQEQLPDPPEDTTTTTEEERLEFVERGLFEFAGIVVNYRGKWEFDDTAFDAAFNEQFEPRFSDRTRARFLLPLKNTTLEPGISIDLETDIQGDPELLGPYGIAALRIRTLDDLEETGIVTFEAPQTATLEPISSLERSRPTPAHPYSDKRQNRVTAV